MSDSASRLPARPSLEQLRKQAKELLKEYRAGDEVAAARFRVALPFQFDPALSGDVRLADAQFVLAREYGFENWARLVHHIEAITKSGLDQFERLAQQLATAYTTGDAMAIRKINWDYGTSFVSDREPERMQQRLPAWFASKTRLPELALADARQMIANSYGIESWEKFEQSFARPLGDPRHAPRGMDATPPFYKIDWQERSISARGPLSKENWDTVYGVMEDYQLTRLNAGGIPDEAMQGLARLDHVTRLSLSGSTRLTDEGIKLLAGMPQLQELEIGGWSSPLTDRGLEVLRHLPRLKRFQSCWSQHITDAGLAYLAFCDQLEEADLMGTLTGDGAIKALAGKRNLRRFKTGRMVTDAGLPFLHEIPAFKTWQGGEIKYDLMSFDARPTDLLLDGPFTDQGLASLAGLDGLFGLSFFWHVSAMTPAGLKALANLANLGFLGCQGELCNDEAMQSIATIPRLRMLMGQGTVASDQGFAALSRSQTIEYIWGRECPNLGGPGFRALARMGTLKGLAVSCKNVDDAALSALPSFPALRGLLPMDVPEDGFRHVGRCEQLENLWCMYCADTGDIATEHIAGLSHLKTYYAGSTRITDRSLEILSRMRSLEKLEFWDCAGITDAGIAFLSGLPHLREVTVSSSPKVTREGMAIFPPAIRTNLW